MPTNFDERLFVSDEIKDIVDFERKDKPEDLDLFVRSNNKNYKIIKIKHGSKLIKIHMICDSIFVENFYKKGNDIFNVYLNSTLIYNINFKTQLSCFSYKKTGESYLLKICIENSERKNDGVWIW